MAWTFRILLFLCVFFLSGDLRPCISGSFKFDIHHRFSDAIKGMFDSQGLPEKHTPAYYAAMVHRDRLFHGRQLAATNTESELTFVYGNQTYFISSLGFLYYANISVGTPSIYFLVALDTGSDLLWLPCDCTDCPTGLKFPRGQTISLNHYSPSTSTTSKGVPCSSSLCDFGSQCSSPTNICPYQVQYLSANTSSTGYLVEDVLHLITDDSNFKPVNPKITFGCGKIQTGIFTRGVAPNGLLGLGMDQISVPSILASQGLTSNSFSMCFGPEGLGRIDFGDTGSLNQRQTPFNPMALFPSYNVSFTQINVGGKINNVGFTAIFDSGTSFTYLNDPVYSLITEQFDSGMTLKRLSLGSDFPFEYCYELPATAKSYSRPILNFTMKGGDVFGISHPTIVFSLDDPSAYAVCLGIIQSPDMFVLIGQNFMTDYQIVFNREKMVLGWEPSDCGYGDSSGTPSDSPPADSPPSDSPPSDSPPTDSPPSNSPPTDSPPSDSPPSNSPPTKSPPSRSPPTNSPPTKSPPSNSPPTKSPPSNSPPTKSPPSDSPPTDTPSSDSPPSDLTPPDSPPSDSPPSNRTRVGGGGGATRLNPFACVFTGILAILVVF